MPAGVLISQEGYTLDTDAIALDVPSDTPFTFRTVGPDGAAVTRFVDQHERELHLIAVSTDLGTYVHLHPARSDDGLWSSDLPTLAPGVDRAFADSEVHTAAFTVQVADDGRPTAAGGTDGHH